MIIRNTQWSPLKFSILFHAVDAPISLDVIYDDLVHYDVIFFGLVSKLLKV